MTKATREATIEEYMELVKEGDHDKVVAFINECFGTDEDHDIDACATFADTVEPIVTEFVKEELEAAPVATPEMMENTTTVDVEE